MIFADIEYEKLSDFCSHCRKAGHSVNNCKLLNKSLHKNAFVPKSNVGSRKDGVVNDNIIFDKVANLGVGPNKVHSVHMEKSTLEPHAPPNFVSQPFVDTNSISSDCMAATVEDQQTVQFVDVDDSEALNDRNFLRNSWVALADDEDVGVSQDVTHKRGHFKTEEKANLSEFK